MVKNQIIVESVVFQGLGVRATASKYGVSPAWVSTLVARYRAEGPSAFEPRSKRPHSNKLATPPAVEDRIIELRKELSDIGTDNGADTIHTHLEREFAVVPSISTIQRLNGSMAVYAYTNDQSLEVLDLDLSCTEAAFPALLNALEAHSMSANVTNWHVLQVRDESMQVEIDSEETWMAGINLVPRASTSMDSVSTSLIANRCSSCIEEGRML